MAPNRDSPMTTMDDLRAAQVAMHWQTMWITRRTETGNPWEFWRQPMPSLRYKLWVEWNMWDVRSWLPKKDICIYIYIYMLAPLEIHFWSCLQWVWACIIGIEHKYIKLTNSRFKKISSKKRKLWYKKIAAKSKFAIGMFSARIIDKISIRHATILAYCNAIQQLQLSK